MNFVDEFGALSCEFNNFLRCTASTLDDAQNIRCSSRHRDHGHNNRKFSHGSEKRKARMPKADVGHEPVVERKFAMLEERNQILYCIVRKTLRRNQNTTDLYSAGASEQLHFFLVASPYCSNT